MVLRTASFVAGRLRNTCDDCLPARNDRFRGLMPRYHIEVCAWLVGSYTSVTEEYRTRVQLHTKTGRPVIKAHFLDEKWFPTHT